MGFLGKTFSHLALSWYYLTFPVKQCTRVWKHVISCLKVIAPEGKRRIKAFLSALMRGVNGSADRRIWPNKAHGLWISAINRADSRIWKIPWIAGQLKVLARFPDSVSLEVRIVDRIINFRSALVNVLVFCRLTFHFRGFRKRLSRDPTHIHVF